MNSPTKQLVWIVIVLIAALTLLACDLSTLLPSSSAPAEPTQPSAAPASPAPSQPPSGAQPPAATKPAPSSGGRDTPLGRIADPSELNSYRARMLLEFRAKDAKPAPMRMTMEWVKNPPAQHITMGEGAQAMEVITIGDKAWVKMGAGWIESPPSQAQGSAQTPESYLPEQDVKVQPLGDDTVNGVRCKKQAYSGKVTVTMPAIQNRPETKLTFNVKGEMCVANQPGLPPVVVREKGELEGNLFGMLFQAALGGATKTDVAGTTYVERELYDINAAITINPPQNVTQLPGMPTVPGAKPSPGAKPTVAAKPTIAANPTTVPPPAVGVQFFSDEFSSATLNAKWRWEDRWQDAKYDLKARPGFIRITAPTANDLWPDTNFDAPYLVQPVDGNFVAETSLEFAPTQVFQGAGLIAYQDDDNLIRLERAFGGAAGSAGVVHFSVIRDGETEIITGFDQAATEAKKVELRLQRVGNQFTAWWREPGKAWQSLGSTAVPMAGTVQVGITVLAEYDAPDSVADFEYFRLSRPK